MGRFIAAGVAAGVLALAAGGCGATSDGSSGGSGGGSASCLVLANGGNKVCGADAAAWCRATDSIRQGTTDPTLQQTQTDCNELEAQYPSS